jgi:hypothetical protein
VFVVCVSVVPLTASEIIAGGMCPQDPRKGIWPTSPKGRRGIVVETVKLLEVVEEVIMFMLELLVEMKTGKEVRNIFYVVGVVVGFTPE